MQLAILVNSAMVRSVDKRWNLLWPDIITLYRGLQEIGLNPEIPNRNDEN